MQNTNDIIIIGAGGHGKVVLSTLLAMGEKILGFVDDNPNLIGTEICGYKVLGNLAILNDIPQQAAIFGIGNNNIRKKIAATHKKLKWKTAIHPSAHVHETVKVGQGTVIFAGTIIQPDSVIGEHAIINTAVSVDHDCYVHDYAHIAPGSHLAGSVVVEEGCFIGIKSCAIYGISIGRWSTIGAGSVIVKAIGDYAYAKGVPAEVYKTVTLME